MRPPKHMFLVIIFIFMLMTLQSDANYAIVHKNILIINSYHHGLSWTDDLTNAEINTIKSGYSGDVKFYVEYMDWKEHPTEETLILFEDLMAYKYEDMNIDLIIASDDAAFEFILEKRGKLFGDIPIVFNGISESSFESLVTIEDNFTGVLEIVDIKTTLEMAQMVNPVLDTFYIIYDETESGRSMGEAAAIEVHRTLSDIEVVKITNLSIEDIISFVSSLESKDSILMTAYYTDVHGMNINFEDMIQKVSESTSAAVFSLYDFALGKGALGGNLLSGKLIGERTAELAIEILNGADADDLELIRTGIHMSAIDYDAALDYNIDFKRLSSVSLQVISDTPSLSL
ncbi:MAG: ABC transporter substrate binding protein [Bacillota bacterium]|nr:ABC transporter substrate binding protein [Bacillota bacterium]